MKRTSLVSASALVLALLVGLAGPASASGRDGQYIVVTPQHQQGWSTADTRPGGAVNFVVDPTAPSGRGALQLTTDLTTTAKAQYLHAANTPLADVTELSYYTKQNSAPFPGAAASYQVAALLNGASGFTTLVFEPYQGGQGAVLPSVWQQWHVDAGLFWSTRPITCSNGTIAGSPGGPATYTLDAVKTACPNAVVIGFGVNIGSNNPGYNVETDLFNFNGTTYDFEPTHACDKGQSDHDGDKENCGNHFGQDGDHEGDADD